MPDEFFLYFTWWQLSILIIAVWILGFISGVGGQDDWKNLVNFIRYLRRR